MTVTAFTQELRQRDVILYYTGLFHFILAVIVLGLSFIDDRTIMGLNAWVKPFKFSISIGIYAWTYGWLMFYLKRKRLVKFLSWGIAVTMVIEIACLLIQAARGVRSHYNVSSAFDASIFSTMGTMIAFNTIILVIVFGLFLIEKPKINPSYLLGIRLGMITFLLASAIGGIMISNFQHAVGVADGGEGLPLLNWSTKGGDLRIGHFLGMHGIQVIPFLAYLISVSNIKWKNLAVTAIFLVYTGLIGFVFFQAMQGIPLIAFE